MSLWNEQVVPRLTDRGLGTPSVHALRARVTLGLAGEVLEIGFGSGLNVGHYPPEVTRVVAVEPLLTSRRRAAVRIAQSSTPIEWVGLDGQALPLPDASVDAALSTFTLCTIPDVAAALTEIRRVLRPGGHFHFLEHGHAPSPRVARWQDRLNPWEQRLVGGCNLNRRIVELIEAAGLYVDQVEREYIGGLPKPWGAAYLGRAHRSPDA
jgi:ubiquinone/menaquinone biosynthesis C-methylase UbiE